MSNTIIIIDDSDSDDDTEQDCATAAACLSAAVAPDQETNGKIQSLMAVMNIPTQKMAREWLQACSFDLERTIAHLLDAKPPAGVAQDAWLESKPAARRSLFAQACSSSTGMEDTAAAVTVTVSNNAPSASSRGPTKNAQNEQESTPHELSPQWHEAYQRTVQTEQDFFVDFDFPPTTTSLDGRKRVDDSGPLTTNAKATVIKCHCGLPAAPRTVQSDGPNYGRFYLACGQKQRGQRARRAKVVVVRSPDKKDDTRDDARPVIRNPYAKPTNSNHKKTQPKTSTPPTPIPTSPPQRKLCNFFQWDPDGKAGAAGYSTRYSLLAWQHFGRENRCCLYRKAIDPSQVRQGAVGNCWFLSALAVVAEKPYLVRQLLPHCKLNDKGCYQVNLCLDGQWTPVIVDSNLPVVLEDTTKKKSAPSTLSKSAMRGGVGWEKGGDLVAYPAFCAAPNHNLWAALVEKAYAKAHGSYAQLSGGFIAEGLTDLTGAPTETIIFAAGMLDRDELWVRLVSFAQAGFLMGVATSQGGDGLVGGHAYSVLDVIEVHDSVVGEQSKVTDYFKCSPDKKKAKVAVSKANSNQADEKGSTLGERTTVRLVRIRNPWGTREWKGDWSADSERWTKALRERLGSSDTFAKGDGTFFMSFDDVLERFHHMDIAKTHEGWKYSSCDGVFECNMDPLTSSRHVYLLKPSTRTMASVSLVQPKKRSNTQSKYWYCDPNMLILRKKPQEDRWTCEARALVGTNRTSHCEVFLDPNYIYCCVPFSCVAHKSNTVDFDLRLTVYSASPVSLERRDNYDGCREDALRVLHGELLRREDKLFYPVSSGGLLACIHGEGCLFFVAVNGSHDQYLSLRLMIEVQDGILIVFGSNEDTHDIAPRSQRLLLVLSRTAKFSPATHLNFRYLSSTVPVKSGRTAAPVGRDKHPVSFGGTLDITLAGDLIAGSFDPTRISNKGGDTVDTYRWIPQIGASSFEETL